MATASGLSIGEIQPARNHEVSRARPPSGTAVASRHPAPTTAGDIEDPDPSRGSRSRSNGRSTITILNTEPRLTWTDEFARVVRAHVDGYASDEDVARLKAEPEDWVEVLVDLRHRARTALDHVHSTVHGPERELVLEDFQSDYDLSLIHI